PTVRPWTAAPAGPAAARAPSGPTTCRSPAPTSASVRDAPVDRGGAGGCGQGAGHLVGGKRTHRPAGSVPGVRGGVRRQARTSQTGQGAGGKKDEGDQKVAPLPVLGVRSGDCPADGLPERAVLERPAPGGRQTLPIDLPVRHPPERKSCPHPQGQ